MDVNIDDINKIFDLTDQMEIVEQEFMEIIEKKIAILDLELRNENVEQIEIYEFVERLIDLIKTVQKILIFHMEILEGIRQVAYQAIQDIEHIEDYYETFDSSYEDDHEYDDTDWNYNSD